MLGHHKGGEFVRGYRNEQRTVDGNGDALRENEAILALKGGNLA